MRLPSLATLLYKLVPAFLLPLFTNLASSDVPVGVRPWLRLAWPGAVALALFVVWSETRAPHVVASLSEQPAREDPDTKLEIAARRVAQTVQTQWSDEAVLRGLIRPQPVRLKWSATRRLVAAHPAAVLEAATIDGNRARLVSAGDLTDLAARFRQLPLRRLVVLGEPGAGKSALVTLLTLDLLNDPQPGDAIPVLLSVASWNPSSVHLHTWLVRRLNEEHPYLADVRLYGSQAAQRLLAAGRIMPVLDGLDEMPAALQTAAIDALDRVAGALVVTCRTSEYQAAVDVGGRVLADAAVVEIEAVALDDAAAFLTSPSPSARARWAPVLSHLHATATEVPLAQALRTPLMVALARTVYTNPAANPTELLDTDRFPNQAALERHLLDAFVSAAYRNDPPAPGAPAAARHRRTYEPEHAIRWLAFLAGHLTDLGTPDFAWWNLRAGFRRPRLALGLLGGSAIGLTVFVTFLGLGLASGLPTWPKAQIWAALRADVVLALIPALAAALTLALVKPQLPNRGMPSVRVMFHRSAGELRRPGQRRALAIAIAVTAGLAVATRAFPGFARVLQVTIATPAAIIAVLAVVVVPSYAAVRLTRWPVDVSVATDSTSVLRNERWASLIRALISTVGTVLAVEGLFRLAGTSATTRTEFILSLGIVPGVIVGLIGAWATFLLTRTWYALRGDLPFALSRFLEDAHRRGVLRQAGAAYQFRHARLQEHLANSRANGPGRVS